MPHQYQIVPTKTFLKDLEKIVHSQYGRRIEQAVDKLAQNPYKGIKVTDVGIGIWRIRVGDYRIRYDIEDDKVILHRVLHRKDIYKRS